jgi:CLIP-associating protein 1/2
MVVFCLVETYIMLGKPFVPYLGSLSSTQLRLVTIYANYISQVYIHLSTHCPVPSLVSCTNGETLVNFINEAPSNG